MMEWERYQEVRGRRKERTRRGAEEGWERREELLDSNFESIVVLSNTDRARDIGSWQRKEGRQWPNQKPSGLSETGLNQVKPRLCYFNKPEISSKWAGGV